MAGSSSRSPVRLAEPVAAISFLCLAAAPAPAQQPVAFNIPAGRLSDALIALGQQAGITIGTSEAGLGNVRVRGLRGRMPVREALNRLLAGSGYTFSYVGPGAVRILRAAPVRRASAPPAPRAPVPAMPAPEAPPAEIIVTASKQGVPLERFAGSAHVIDLSESQPGRFGARGSAAVLERLPMLASTSLGPGRNKLYIRGVADSSFNGPSQSIVGQTYGDVRLTFNAPDPDLQLVDMAQVEVLEGPQGTLYGTGSLGGLLRLVPNPVDLGETAASLSGGLLATRHGNPGGDLAGMLNVPLVPGRLALRAVGYGAVDGGYIDDAGRGLRNVNRVTDYGGRATLLLDAGDGWRVELGGLAQYIAGRDGQYAMRGLPPLTRSSSVAQPFDNDYQLGQLTVRKRWPGVELVSATGIVRHALETRFDATGFPGTAGPQLYMENVGITLLSNETRLSQPNARGEGWVIGWSLLHDINRIRRRLGPPAATLPIAGVRNEVTEAALFGQYSLGLADRLTATLGGRLTWSRSIGQPLDAPPHSEEPSRTDLRFSPTAALSWRLGGGTLLYARVQRGFRAGGLAVTASGAATAVQRFESDSLTSWELGMRTGVPGHSRFSFDASLSYARWADIQADLVDSRGLPYTANIGNGRILGLEVEATWRATPALSFDAAFFLNNAALTSPAPAFVTTGERDLPNIADSGGRVAAHLRTILSPALALQLDGAVRYVGHSQLGIGPPLDVKQGGFVEAQLGARLDFGQFAVSLDVDNLTDARGNRFSFGNPFTVGQGMQTTPLRPRTVRIGFDAHF